MANEKWELCDADDDRARLVPPKRLGLREPPDLTSHEKDARGTSVSIAEYLRLERSSSIKHEYIGGRVYAMAGASDAHNAITTNLVALLHPIVRAKGCRIYSSDMKVRIDTLSPEDEDAIFYYPDVMVVCAQGDDEQYFKTQPSLLIEVWSESTEAKDRTTKLDHYRTIGTLVEYWMIAQDRRRIEVWRRDGGVWSALEYKTENDVIHVGALGTEVLVKDVYEEVTFE